MKQALAVILALFYFTSNVGATVHLHYCMGEFVALSLTDKTDAVCGKCGMKNHNSDNNCCTDIKVVKKSSDTHQPNGVIHFLNTPFPDIIPSQYYQQERHYQPERMLNTALDDYSPPDHTFPPLYIQHKNFRI